MEKEPIKKIDWAYRFYGVVLALFALGPIVAVVAYYVDRATAKPPIVKKLTKQQRIEKQAREDDLLDRSDDYRDYDGYRGRR